MTTVEPRLYRGLRDDLPPQMGARQRMLDTIRDVYESYGFVPLGTPAIEHLDVLTGSAGSDATGSIFGVTGPEKDHPLGLRFDLTVPLARVVSMYKELPRPFRRYQVASVWRADKPDKGRYREFTQFDIDSVGVESDLADTEIIAAICDSMDALGVGRYRVRFSSRRILGLLLKFAGVPERVSVRGVLRDGSDVFRVLDKLDKIGLERVKRELTTGYKDDSGDVIPGLGLENSQVERIERFLAIKGDSRDAVLSRLAETFDGVENAAAEIDVLRRISGRLGELGYGDDRATVDLSIARGLAYYTGPVFETTLVDAPEFGSVCSGGRYDDLVLRFMGERLPAVGASIGVDRLLAALIELKRIEVRYAVAQVLITTMDPALERDYLTMAFELRRAGIRTELFLGSARFGKQVKHADQQGIPVVVVMGSNEKERGVVQIKSMQTGKDADAAIPTGDRSQYLEKKRAAQVEVARGDLVAAVRRLLSE